MRDFIAEIKNCESTCGCSSISVSGAALMKSMSRVACGFCDLALESLKKVLRDECRLKKHRSHMFDIYTDYNVNV
jgi:hypothetical protein